MMTLMKKLASRLPESVQLELKRRRYARLMRRGAFWPDDPEAARLREWVGEGDWVLDIGASIGTYAWALSSLVGPEGRVICFEPVPSTFAVLAVNARSFPHQNVTLVNAAVSRRSGTVGVTLPAEYGHESHYYARVVAGRAPLNVLSVCIDDLPLEDAKISFVKMDVEGHEEAVVEGMMTLLARDRPRLVIEGSSTRIEALLQPLGYHWSRREGSPNTLYESPSGADAAVSGRSAPPACP
ncbi:MAG: FkbM family methyltransferase, partial [Gemmatimonadetes bacterium]|nr:FkbM family methyltransferase [Gemmatimonadota bacterium]